MMERHSCCAHLRDMVSGNDGFARMPFLPVDQPRLQEVFSMATPLHMLLKLHWEAGQFRRFIEERSDSPFAFRDTGFVAFNCAITAFHCADWAWSAAGQCGRDRLSDAFAFKASGSRSEITFYDALEKANRDFFICRQIANGSKHMRRGKRNHPIAVSVEYSAERSEREDRYCVDFVIMDGSTKLLAVDVFDRMARFWSDLYFNLGFLEDRFVSP